MYTIVESSRKGGYFKDERSMGGGGVGKMRSVLVTMTSFCVQRGEGVEKQELLQWGLDIPNVGFYSHCCPLGCGRGTGGK